MDVKSRPRRRHSAKFKAQVLAACREPGTSVAAVARAFGLNDNMVYEWRRIGAEVSACGVPETPALRREPSDFVVLSLPCALPGSAPVPTPSVRPASGTEEIRMDFKRGALAVRVAWPVSAAADCAAWLGELLR